MEEELSRLKELREELKREFGKDLWEKSLERQRGKGTTEDLYFWYKKQLKVGQTPSEMTSMHWVEKQQKDYLIFINMKDTLLKKITIKVIDSCKNDIHFDGSNQICR